MIIYKLNKRTILKIITNFGNAIKRIVYYLDNIDKMTKEQMTTLYKSFDYKNEDWGALFKIRKIQSKDNISKLISSFETSGLFIEVQSLNPLLGSFFSDLEVAANGRAKSSVRVIIKETLADGTVVSEIADIIYMELPLEYQDVWLKRVMEKGLWEPEQDIVNGRKK